MLSKPSHPIEQEEGETGVDSHINICLEEIKQRILFAQDCWSREYNQQIAVKMTFQKGSYDQKFLTIQSVPNSNDKSLDWKPVYDQWSTKMLMDSTVGNLTDWDIRDYDPLII